MKEGKMGSLEDLKMVRLRSERKVKVKKEITVILRNSSKAIDEENKQQATRNQNSDVRDLFMNSHVLQLVG